MPSISIIVPLYNVEAYLPECLDSIACQTMDDFEVICVNDGSTDGSADIARRKAQGDKRFKLVSKENGGLSSARNRGLDEARGTFVMFVDGDDLLEPRACERVMGEFALADADVVMFGASVMPESESTPWHDRVLAPEAGSFKGFDPSLVFSENFSPFVWNLAVRRQALDDSGVRFDEDVLFGEDVVFQLALIPRVGRIVRIPDRLYRYRLNRTGSLMDSHASDRRRLSAHLALVEKVFADWQELGLLGQYAEEARVWSEDYLLRGVDRLPAPERAEHLGKVGEMWSRYFDGMSCHPAKVSIDCQCRGEGKLYMKCSIEALLPFSSVECSVDVGGVELPASAYPYTDCETGSSQTWVLELPLLDWPSMDVSLRPDGHSFQQAHIKTGYTKAKWLSRLNYRLKGSLCSSIRDFERSFTRDRYQLEVCQRFAAGEMAVWRVELRWMGDPACQPTIEVLDQHGAPVDAECMLFEFQPAGPSSMSEENMLYLSLKAPSAATRFLVVARDDSGRIAPGFTVVDGERADRLTADARELMKSAGDDDAAYREWFARHRAQVGDLIAQREAASEIRQPLFSIMVMAKGGSFDGLESTLGSLAAQTYGSWEAVVVDASRREMASSADDPRFVFTQSDGVGPVEAFLARAAGDYAAFVVCGDLVEPNALFEYACMVRGASGADAEPVVLYCDEDVVQGEGVYGEPLLKSRLNVDSLYCRNWVGNLLAVKSEALLEMGCSGGRQPYAWMYDCALRAYEAHPDGFAHVPQVLYHAQISPLVSVEDGDLRRLLAAHLARRGVKAKVVAGPVKGSARIRYDMLDPHPLVSIIIPNKDRIDLLEPCVSSILEKSTYDRLEVLVVENNSTEPGTFAYYEQLEQSAANVRVLRWPAEFNYSKLMNFGAEHAQGDYLLMLNNDTEVIEPSFIEEMLGCLQRPEVGVVGARLLFRDDLVQHAGIGVGVWNAVVHVNQNRYGDDGGYLDRACLPGNYSAVTGACQMVRADVYRQIGGYDERFSVGFNDIDFCMRILKSGRLVSYTPYAVLHHYEFSSRGREVADNEKLLRWKREQALFMQLWPKPFVEGDPYAGANLMRDNTYYRLGE